MTDTINVDGRDLINFLPQDNVQGAIVSLNVIQRLAELLPSVDLKHIREYLTIKINNSKNLEDLINMLSDEVEFHRSVNLITEYKLVKEEKYIKPHYRETI